MLLTLLRPSNSKMRKLKRWITCRLKVSVRKFATLDLCRKIIGCKMYNIEKKLCKLNWGTWSTPN